MKAKKASTARTLALRSGAKGRANPPAATSSDATPGGRSIINPTPQDSTLHNVATYTCAGCHKPIKRDRFLLKASDRFWHENCLKCDRCGSRLGELDSIFYSKSDMNLCRQDYLELFGRKGTCTLCNKMIKASELVMRARENVYHLDCFACQLCSQRFCVGDQFYLCDNKVVCQYDYLEHIVPLQESLEALSASNDVSTVGHQKNVLNDKEQEEEQEEDYENRHQELTLLLGSQMKKHESLECTMHLLGSLANLQKDTRKDDSSCNTAEQERSIPEELEGMCKEHQQLQPKSQPSNSLLACDMSASSSSSLSSTSSPSS